jgi:hypothetical protein
VLEAGDAVDGRMRTDRQAGFPARPRRREPRARGPRSARTVYQVDTGDWEHRATYTAEGALASGARAARVVLAAAG